MTETVSKLLKINVRARSMEKARAIFCDLLGGELLHDRGGNTIGDFDGAMVRVGDVTIDLVVPNDPNGRLARVIDKHGEGLDSICFSVESMDATREALRAKGVEFASESDFGGSRVAFVHPRETGGVALEFIEQHGPSED